LRIELHCHSNCSDGLQSAQEVARCASNKNIEIFALTDHDTCAGSEAAKIAGADNIRAVEISCSDDSGHTVHLLAYDTGGDWSTRETALIALREHRKNRLRMMAARLQQRGITVDVTSLLLEAERRSVGRPDLARAMVASGISSSMKEAFSRHLYDRGPVDVPHKALGVGQAIEIARSAGARVSLAHPHLYEGRTLPLIAAFRHAGLSGLEAFYGRYDAAERKRWSEIADDNQMICTGGSDSHGEPEIQRGVEISADRGGKLREWLGLA
jgi:3',5'-nucleoside bisphosphate phosphatase